MVDFVTSILSLKDGEREGEIDDIDPVLDHLMEYLLLQAPLFLIKASHHLWTSYETSLPTPVISGTSKNKERRGPLLTVFDKHLPAILKKISFALYSFSH